MTKAAAEADLSAVVGNLISCSYILAALRVMKREPSGIVSAWYEQVVTEKDSSKSIDY
jgi:hypothetical protein